MAFLVAQRQQFQPSQFVFIHSGIQHFFYREVNSLRVLTLLYLRVK